MKVLIVCLLGGLTIFSACNTGPKGQVYTPPSSRYAVAWPGEYVGLIPCADCEGIETIITLHKDETYSLKTRYRGKATDFEEKNGKMQWDKKGNIVYLEGGAPGGYRVGEHKITQLDIQGNPIMGKLATRYILLQRTPGIQERYWKLVELKGRQITKTDGMKREPYLIVKEEDQRFALHGGCNLYTGTYTLRGRHHLKVSKLSGTLLNCGEMGVEQQLVQIMNHSNTSYTIRQDTLLIGRDKKTPLARFHAVYFE